MSTRPVIGSRWTCAEAARIDTAAGTYEHVNARVYCDADSLRLQRVLLAPQPVRGNGRIRGALLCVALFGTIGAMLALQL